MFNLFCFEPTLTSFHTIINLMSHKQYLGVYLIVRNCTKLKIAEIWKWAILNCTQYLYVLLLLPTVLHLEYFVSISCWILWTWFCTYQGWKKFNNISRFWILYQMLNYPWKNKVMTNKFQCKIVIRKAMQYYVWLHVYLMGWNLFTVPPVPTSSLIYHSQL